MAHPPLMSVEDALQAVLSKVPEPRFVRVPLAKAVGLVLAEPVTSDLDMPPFDKSMMDGYAVRSADVADPPVDLDVVKVIHAGDMPSVVIEEGQAAKIMTGAPLPEGTDAVVMVESSEEIGPGRVRLREGAVPGRHVAPRGEDIHDGDRVLEAGVRIGPSQISVLAAVGETEVLVLALPRVMVLTTGDEVVPPDVTPGPGQIRNSNSIGLVARVFRDGADATDGGIVPDDLRATRETVRRAMDEYDIVLLTGGVSMGDRDLVGPALNEEGFDQVLHKVNMKPGKPVLFGTRGRTLVFGLPGNPVSAAVTYEIFVRPALRKLMGHKRLRWREQKAVLSGREIRSVPRTQYLPATAWRAPDLQVALVAWHGSGDLFSFARANALLVVPAGGPAPSPGELADVILLDDAPDRPGAVADA